VADLSVQALVNARCRERERLSKILHDDITGGLTAAGLSLDLLAMDVPPELAACIRDIQGLLERSFESVRELSHEFHPDPAIRFQLVPALQALALRFRKRFQGTLKSQFSAATEGLLPEQARAYYAVAEAALDNVLRHSRARHAWLVFESASQRGFALTIRDDGRGFEESIATRGTGMAVMEYHVLVAELKLSIQSEVERGTRVQVSPANSVLNKRGSHEDGD
jgi:two-component system sensor histidine kinase UhpB